jgi:hypothetical protein
MGLTQAQQALINRARTTSGTSGAVLAEAVCAYLCVTIIYDLGLQDHFPDLPTAWPEFYAVAPDEIQMADVPYVPLLVDLLRLDANADTYFYCLATLHKARLKYNRIMQAQPVPTVDQIGPRILLHYGQAATDVLYSWLRWRKWIFDIDNRAAQETGYLFEPILTAALGGTGFGARRSPIKRYDDLLSGRQVDCILGQSAYEIKLRVTTASSGQGRWNEALRFPEDCRFSGFTPILIVLDPTPNPKLDALERAYRHAEGTAYIGADAWAHLSGLAGETLSLFMRRYIQQPLDALLQVSQSPLHSLALRMTESLFSVEVGSTILSTPRSSLGNDEHE